MGNSREIIKKYNIRPTKSLGQNFLVDESAVEKIIDAGEIDKNDIIIEIGPGTGSMTAKIANKARRLVAVEIDRHLIPALSDSLKNAVNVEILNRDIMKMDLDELIAEQRKLEGEDLDIKIIANLPYYITTPIIMKLLEGKPDVKKMVFMVQKEVADRMVANPGKKDYGALSVAVQYYSKPSRIFDVPPDAFIPPPKVYSTVIVLDVYENSPYEINDVPMFFRIVKAAFAQRRKTLSNALFNSGFFNQTKEQIAEILQSHGISPTQRGETLSISQFGELADDFSQKKDF